jgi:amino acid transporter
MADVSIEPGILGARRPPAKRPGLKREIGFIGLLWASGGSIIGSGWLFGAQGALATAGPAAIVSWVIGAVAILLLALVHAELGAMYPVAGGTARFPHYAFGGLAGASFGWFSWLQAATVAPIEVMAMIQYGQHYSFASGWMKLSNGQHVLTTTGIVAAVCFLPFPSWRSLVGLITSASVLMYAGAPLALGAFRNRLPEAERPYRLPRASVIAPLSFVVANFLILWSGWTTDYKLGIAILIGYVILAANVVFKLNPVKPQLDLRAALWLPVYLVGTGLIVYLSDFGPLKNPVFPLWWDMVAVAAFSLAIYFWAQRVALPTERIEATISTASASPGAGPNGARAAGGAS